MAKFFIKIELRKKKGEIFFREKWKRIVRCWFQWTDDADFFLPLITLISAEDF